MTLPILFASLGLLLALTLTPATPAMAQPALVTATVTHEQALADAPAASDFAMARDAFIEVCSDLSSIGAVERSARIHGWQAFEPAPGSSIAIYLASERPHRSGVTFYPIRRVIAGRNFEILFFEQSDRGDIGGGLHCNLFMDEGRGFPVDEILSWSTAEPDNLFEFRLFEGRHPYGGPLLQWRPGVFPSHDQTTVEFHPPGEPAERNLGVGIQIWSINLPPGRED